MGAVMRKKLVIYTQNRVIVAKRAGIVTSLRLQVGKRQANEVGYHCLPCNLCPAATEVAVDLINKVVRIVLGSVRRCQATEHGE